MSDEGPIRGPIEPSLPTMRDLAMVLFRRRRVFITVWVLVIVTAIVYAITGTKYRANMKILIRRGRAEAPVSALQNAPLDLTRLSITDEELNSEVELLRDEEVLRKVVEKTRIGGRDWLHVVRMSEGPRERVERAARNLAKKVKVEPVKKTNLISVSYAAGNPEVATKVLQALGDLYVQKHTNLHRPMGQLEFFEQQVEASQQHLDEASEKLRSFGQSHRVVAAAQERDLALQKVSDLDSERRKTLIEIAETQQRVHELEQQLAMLPERTTTQIRTADNPELMKALKFNLLELQLKRTELLMKFEPSHRLVKEVDQQIVQAETAIVAENSFPLRDETTDKNSNYEWAKAELQRAQVQLKSLQSREAAVSAHEAGLHGQAKKLGEDAIVQDDLISRERAAEENYLLYVKKREEARLNDALDERGIVNVAIAEQPTVPALPVWSGWIVLAFGFLAAGAIGAGAAFTADYIDPRFRDPDDVVAYLDVPVLASLPRTENGRLAA